MKKSRQRSRNVSSEERPRSDLDGLQRRSRSMDAFPKGLPRPTKPQPQVQRRIRPLGDSEVQSNIDVYYQTRSQSCERSLLAVIISLKTIYCSCFSSCGQLGHALNQPRNKICMLMCIICIGCLYFINGMLTLTY